MCGACSTYVTEKKCKCVFGGEVRVIYHFKVVDADGRKKSEIDP